MIQCNPVNCWKPEMVISSQADQEWAEGSETRSHSPERTMKTHERGAPQEGDDIVRYSLETRRGEDKEPRRNRCSNFGEFVVVPDRHMPTFLGTNVTFNVIYLVDYEYLAFAELDPIDVIPVAKTGDADKAMIVCEGCLEVRSEHAFGAVMGYEYSVR